MTKKPYIYSFRGCIPVYRVTSSSTPRLTQLDLAKIMENLKSFYYSPPSRKIGLD
jgi:hypothetical protein